MGLVACQGLGVKLRTQPAWACPKPRPLQPHTQQGGSSAPGKTAEFLLFSSISAAWQVWAGGSAPHQVFLAERTWPSPFPTRASNPGMRNAKMGVMDQGLASALQICSLRVGCFRAMLIPKMWPLQ